MNSQTPRDPTIHALLNIPQKDQAQSILLSQYPLVTPHRICNALSKSHANTALIAFSSKVN
ncbi:hypothetical protein BTUL_0053g00400 [Botrytis tulipae]|uniref:Uncharacterized protein n=1 Tax=Botrytis tulipae TaxID=87230 RepID=A0A4Z1EYZ3_9HELO|nr:hypothetical protein BTUL_0053g00400 [Botrytis tulipae]